MRAEGARVCARVCTCMCAPLRVRACLWARACGGRGRRMGAADTKAAPLLVVARHCFYQMYPV